MGLSKEAIIKKAKEIGCEAAAIVAVDTVESKGSGFYSDGKTPLILFEPHIFWKELRKAGLDPNTYAKKSMTVKVGDKMVTMPCDNPSDPILYPTWVPGLYGPSSKQHDRMARAVKIHRESALMSASWGRYQILGNNWKMCGCQTLQEFINKAYASEDAHLDLFVKYVKSARLDDELQQKDWSGFARGYNGPAYTKNQYHIKLAKAYEKAKADGW